MDLTADHPLGTCRMGARPEDPVVKPTHEAHEVPGLFVVDGRRVADTHSRIDHARPHCSSRQLYKGILDEQGRGVFNGLVIVRPGAQQTDARARHPNGDDAHDRRDVEILADVEHRCAGEHRNAFP